MLKNQQQKSGSLTTHVCTTQNYHLKNEAWAIYLLEVKLHYEPASLSVASVSLSPRRSVCHSFLKGRKVSLMGWVVEVAYG